MRTLLLVAALLLSSMAMAVGTTATLTWSSPTTYTNGDPLPVSDIATYSVTQLSDSGVSKLTQAGGTAKGLTLTGLACGKFTLTVVVDTKAGSHSAPVTLLYDTGITCGPKLPGPVTGALVR